MAHVTHTLKVDGSETVHTAEALRYWQDADGCIVVEAACCGKVGATAQCADCSGQDSAGCPSCGGSGMVRDENTLSRHTFYDVGRGTAAGPIDPEAEIRGHVERVAQHHAAVLSARSGTLDGLVKHPAKGAGSGQ